MVRQHHQLKGPQFDQTPEDEQTDREAWYAALHGVTKIQRGGSD